MKKDFNHILLSNVIDSLKLLLIAIGLSAFVAQGAVESSTEVESSPIRFESRDWAEAVYNAASASDSIAIEGGRLKESTVWAPPETHLVFNSVYVPKDITLTIVTNCVVKFCEGTFIKVEDGGKLNIVGAEGKEVILTAANDNTVGTTVPELDPEQTIDFIGIVLQSTAAKFTDNGWIETRGFIFSSYPNISISDQTAYRSSGKATIPITVTGTRNQSFMIDWVAEDGSATYSNDYTLASGRITWEKTGSGKKSIEIPLVVDHITGSNTTFTVRIKSAHGANIIKGVAVVNISEMIFLNIESADEESEPIRFESRSWAEAVYNSASTNEMIIIEGGRLKENTTWAPPETHLVFNSVYIPSGITLTIVTNTVVKFCEGTFIKVEDGGKLDIIGAEGEDVILTAANDNTVGEPIPGLDPEQVFEFPGIIVQSSNATFTDNSWLQTRGFKISSYPNLTLTDIDVFRSTGQASIKVSITGTRNQAFSVDWEAEDGTATLSNDYTLASGRLSWASTYDGSKDIEIPIVTDHIVGSNTEFKVKITFARGVNVIDGECIVTIKELKGNTFESGSMESTPIRFESRPWAEAVFNAASTNEMIIIEGGRLKENTTWVPPETHLVFNSVYIPNGITLTIVTNTVVKFCEGTFIKVEDGGKLNVVGEDGKEVIFTAANDDTAGERIPGFDPMETIAFRGILLSSDKAKFTDNGYLDTRGFNISRYPTITLHEATANRNSGVIYIPITINSVTRNQAFSIDWAAEEGTAKFDKDYTLSSGRITWANSYDGQKNIEIPIVKDHVVGSDVSFTVRFSALHGVNANVKEVTATIAEFKSGELTPETVVELNDSELSPSVPVDEGIQLRPFFLNDVETINYSGKWQNYDASKADKLRVTVESDNGLSILKEAAPAETGSFELKVSDYPVGFYTLKHEIIDAQGTTLAVMQKNFSVMDPESVIWHGGTLTQNEVWTSNKVHVVYATVYVPTTYTLFIEPGTIVKFMRGTGIELLGEAAFFADAIIFTTIDDDTVGGDTLNDGYTGKPPVDSYFLIGHFHFSGDTELRNITQAAPLTGTISTSKLLNRGCIYRVSGSLKIPSGGKLTIPPGTILKMESGASINVTGGELIVNGTHAAPIIMTSIKDDSVGGDTNKDGDKTFPQPGDWRQICVTSGSFEATYLTLTYLSNDNNQGGVYVNGGTVVMDCCTIAHCAYDCMRSYGGFSTFRNTIFTDASMGVAPSGGSNFYINCVFNGLTTAVRWPNGDFVNCVFSDISQTFFDQTGSTPVRNCVLWNPEGYGPQSHSEVGSNNNVWGDPLFVDPINCDFRIVEGSPCVDAADSEKAPETDYFGQPRITITDQGTNTVGQLADIGIYEVMPRNIAGDVDLVPQSINTITNAVPGQILFIKWEVANIGGKEVSGSWRDTIYLVSVDGREVELGTKVTTSTIGAGGSVFCSGYFYVPAIAEGIWYLKVNVNSYHDIFEGSLISNNVLWGDTFINISINLFDHLISNQGIAYAGIKNVIKLKLNEDDENRMMSFVAPKGVTITWGFGTVPVFGAAAGSATSNGKSVQFLVPEGTSDVYIIIETDETTTYELSADDSKIVINDITPNTIPSSGTATLSITGAGFEQGSTVFFSNGGAKISPESVQFVNQQVLTITIDCSKFIAGQSYDLTISNGKLSASLQKALSITSQQGEGHFWARLIVPDSVRQGRKVTCYIEYGNSGNTDVSAQILQVNINGDGKLQYIENIKQFDVLHFVAATSSSGKICAGDTSRIAFILISGLNNDVSLYTAQPKNMEDFCLAVSRVYAFGEDYTDFRLVTNELSPDTSIDLEIYEEYKEYFKDKDFGSKLDVIIEGLNENDLSLVAKNIDSGKIYSSYELNDNIVSFVGLPNGFYRIIAETGERMGVSHAIISSSYEKVYLELKESITINGFVQDPGEESIIAFNSENDTYFSLINYDGSFTIKVSSNIYDISVFALSNRYDDLIGIEINANTNIIVNSSSNESCSQFLSYQIKNDILHIRINKVETIIDYNDRWYETRFTQAQKRVNEGLRLVSLGWSNLRNLGRPTGELNCVHNRAIYNENYRTVKMFSIKLDTFMKNVSMADGTKPIGMLCKMGSSFSDVYADIVLRSRHKAILKRYGNYAGSKLEAKKRLKEILGKLYVEEFGEEMGWKIDQTEAGLNQLISTLNNPEFSEAYFYKVKDQILGLKDIIKAGSDLIETLRIKKILSTSEALEFSKQFFNLDILSEVLDFVECGQDALYAGLSIGEWGFARVHIYDWMVAFENEIRRFAEQLPLKPYVEHCCNTEDDEDISDSEPLQICKPPAVHSCDPNEMSGPLGVGDSETERFVVPGEWLTYTVYFENTSNATAAAQEVYVTNPLSQYLDWRTFEMGDIAFNNQIDLGLAGRQSGTSEVTAIGTNYNVRTQLTLDTEKGEAKWYMRIVDPSTETGWPDDILIGFLPPNDSTYRGEGHLSYRVKVRDDAPAGVTIRNSATIIFDYNDPIETDPAWWNRVAQVQNILIDGTNVTKIVGFPYGKLPVPGARKGWIFVGWFTGPDGTGRLITEDSLVEEGDTALYQYWVRDWHDLNKDDETNAVSDTYDGYIYDVDTHDIKGSIQVKVGKPKNGNAKVTGTVVLVGGTKSDIKATMTMSDTRIDTVLKNGRPLKLVLSSNGMMGTLDKWEISGVRNLFLSKAPGDQAIAETALNQMQGVYTVAWEEGAGYVFASIAIGKNGKAKATGYMANGTKFSATGQLLIGKEEHCVTLVSKSGKTPVGFNLWFAADKSLETEGTQGTSVAGKLGALRAHSFFTCDYLTEPIPVDATGKKWSVTASKLLAFKLSYKDSAGSFKGSFKVGKEKATVNGVVVEGVGYGTAVTKSNGAKAVIIKEIE